MTTTTDTAASFLRQTVQDIFSAAVPIAEAAIITAEPFMATPVLKEVWEEIFKLVVEQFGKAIGVQGAMIVMDVQTFMAVTQAMQSITNLKEAQAQGDPNAISKATQDADLAAQNLLSYIGDAHP